MLTLEGFAAGRIVTKTVLSSPLNPFFADWGDRIPQRTFVWFKFAAFCVI